MSFTPDVLTTEEALASILESPLPALPPQEQRYGSTLVSWWETDPGEVYIHAEDGTPDDRHYASTLVALQLQPHGYRRAQFDMDKQSMAERSGFPELDAAIEEFMQSEFNSPHTTVNDINEYRAPEQAHGNCEIVAEALAEFLKARGFKAYATSDELQFFPGYENAQDSAEIGAGDFSYPEHAAVEVYGLYGPNNVNNVTIDFTASQYGFVEFPKVEGGRVSSRISRMTLPQEKRYWKQLMELAPQGDVIHEFPNGWHIQQHSGWDSGSAVGAFLHNCWQDDVPEEAYSLHDPHGLPRAAIDVDVDGKGERYLNEALGRNNSALKPDQEAMVAEWTRSNGLEYEPSRGSVDAFGNEVEASVHISSQRTSAWPDLMAKAKRLVDSGQVHVLRNGYNNIMGHVVGDHGEYDSEISRDDPNTRSITGWQCTCPWDQYAWQRTRKWKKFEGRPCAHVLGLYWKALSTPLDEQLTEEQAQGMGTGQRMPGDQMIGPRAPVPHVPGGPSGPRVFGPEGPEQGKQMQMNLPPDALGGPPGPAQAPIAPPPGNGGPGGHPGGHPGGPSGPEPPGVIPPFPGEQQQLPWAGPGTTPGGMESPPGAMSLPGAKPPNPFNPIQNPGTYSKVAMPMTRPQQLRAWEQTRMDQGYEPQSEKVWEHPSGWSVQHHPTYGDMKSVGRMLRNCWQSAGSTTANFDDQPLSHDQDAPNHYLPYALHDSDDIPRVAFWATHPNQNYSGSTENLERRIDSPLGPRNSDLYMLENQEARPYLGQFADEQGYYLPSFYRTSKVAADFNPPETVRFKKPVLGIAEGPVQGQYGDGEYRESEDPSGEVISQDPTTGWVEVISPLHSSGPHEPYHIRCFVEPSDIEKTDSTNAFIKRHAKMNKMTTDWDEAIMDPKWDQYFETQEHDYDPRGEYHLRSDQMGHPLHQLAQQRMDELAQHPDTLFERGHVFPARLDAAHNPSGQDALGVYASGTYNEPMVMVDIDAHQTPDVDSPEDEMRRTVDHEVAHATQENNHDSPEVWQGNEDEAEGWKW